MKTIQLTKSEAKVLSAFLKLKKCPSNKTLANKVGLSCEYVRRIMWKLVAKRAIKVNNKLSNKIFYV